MKRKFISLILAVVTALSVMSFGVSASEIKVKFEGQRIYFDVEPQIINDRTMVPLRAIFEALGATVDWNDSTKTVTSRRLGITVEATIGNNTMYINNQGYYMDTAPVIVNGRTLVPVRFIAESFGLQVEWNEDTQTVDIEDNNNNNTDYEVKSMDIENMTSINQKTVSTDRLTDNYGNRYNHAITGWGNGNIKFEYLLNKNYSRFKGIVYVPEGETSNQIRYLQIIADGNTIYTSPEMTKSSEPVDIDIDISRYNDVKIEFNEIWGSWSDLTICLADAGFYQ